jgi:glycosyltransferase involved in cell wall biosynthesis
VSELTERPFKRKIWLRIEKWIFPKLKTVITVNESIAEIYSNTYKVPVHVVRNIPSKREISRGLDRNELNLNEDDFILIIQGSGLNKDRGIEECILSMKYCEQCILLIVGDGDILPLAKNLVKTNELSETVKFIPRKPYEDLMKITELADLGLLMDKNTNKNHEFALPNKLFDYMHAGTPILSNKLKEIERFIMKYDIGIINEDLSPQGISKAIMNYKKDDALQQRLRENCIATSQIENWSIEKKKLIHAIESKD